MESALDTYLAWLGSHGVAFEVAPDLAHHPDHDAPLVADAAPLRALTLDGFEPLREHRDVPAGLAADHATDAVARCLPHPAVRLAGARFLDVGCGTGVLGVIAYRLGALEVLGTDVDPRAVELARATASEAGFEARLFTGALLEALPAETQVDVMVANLPHKPCPAGFALPTSQRGGPDGVEPHASLVPQALAHLAPDGRLLFFLHSLPHPRLLATYAESFDLTLLAWKRRFLRPGEYGPLMDQFARRTADGRSLVLEQDGRHLLIAGTWLATRR